MPKYIVRSQTINHDGGADRGGKTFSKGQEISPSDVGKNAFAILLNGGSVEVMEEAKPQAQSSSDDGDSQEEGPAMTASAKALIEEQGLNPADIAGSGDGGKIIKPDVDAYIAAQSSSNDGDSQEG